MDRVGKDGSYDTWHTTRNPHGQANLKNIATRMRRQGVKHGRVRAFSSYSPFPPRGSSTSPALQPKEWHTDLLIDNFRPVKRPSGVRGIPQVPRRTWGAFVLRPKPTNASFDKGKCGFARAHSKCCHVSLVSGKARGKCKGRKNRERGDGAFFDADWVVPVRAGRRPGPEDDVGEDEDEVSGDVGDVSEGEGSARPERNRCEALGKTCRDVWSEVGRKLRIRRRLGVRDQEESIFGHCFG
ncbi:hypothetical protein KFL_005580060 [Klebsormidium nitens]|uniref:Uncharacterized protein n=1 Tax=Klebsormidium nitens TaxID=105231 RepID=A0A0U9HT35_KLENI|nr:hypothetical protein KFL_005580060 [Klebsormidium nitens]|eukprot:GAQ89754.1 hypothetical protein KFL_005580060 [Klebsormidium nitens]